MHHQVTSNDSKELEKIKSELANQLKRNGVLSANINDESVNDILVHQTPCKNL